MTEVDVYIPSHDKYRYTSDLDPLQLDGFFQDLPKINEESDLQSIYDALVDAVGRIDYSTIVDEESALAALRDLDFIASSYLRHGRDPIQDVPGLEAVMVMLGDMAGTVPRGTVVTYAMVNPSGSRERSFTGSAEESLFIGSVRTSSVVLEHALQRFTTDEPAIALSELESGLQVMVDSVIAVKRGLSPTYFSDELRPYFDPLVIEGRKYLGAGGAQLQLVAFDYVLWGADDPDTMYNEYFAENKDYLSPNQRNLLGEIMEAQGDRSLLARLVEEPDSEAAEASLGVLKMLKKFRYPHRKMAQDNFKVRPEGKLGSGSYTTDILDVLVIKTEEAIKVAEALV